MKERDLSFEALVEVTGATISQERGALNRALSQMRLMVSDLGTTDDELAEMIRAQAERYREVFPTMPLTPSALAKWWGRLEEEAQRLRDLEAAKAKELEEKRKTRGVNLSTRNDCTTCEGGSWVVVGHRKPLQTSWMEERKVKPTTHPDDRGIEEVAPCPVCNLDPPLMKNFWDGRSWDYSEHPGEVVIS